MTAAHQNEVSGWSPQGAVVETTEAESWLLLGGTLVGRLGVSSGDRPAIYPVNFLVDGGTILFRTANGEKLAHLRENPHVVFEADGVHDRGAWSVVVTGLAAVLPAEETLPESVSLPAWAPIEPYVVVRIEPVAIRGRQWQPHQAIERD
jgi:nitroimidazol reductase NimA-like FMN-containing flavoprotein (pyridoxamine 5'-phosphate oxidase superfamily)